MNYYKVLADYPGSHYKIGQIIAENDGRTEYDAPNHFEDYPVIFKKETEPRGYQLESESKIVGIRMFHPDRSYTDVMADVPLSIKL